ncbi:hypothetical protein EJ08DRAFT_693148 [Tothia fuscella]|uniref:Hydrophobin n=1 Tax=Tothia fuscella TaxID=1048955 RepID=A0A9P4P0Z0_9PEZI|nr:hypothetical protein EJ08DRAFT_693148 [Tothia fuscella]
MRSFAIFSIISLALAAPLLEERQYLPVCLGTYGNAQCCATDVLGLADLNCENPSATPTDKQNFVDLCSAVGQQARCCAIPILDQALLCETPV